MLKCYNRGCGVDYDPQNNSEDSCRYHPGVPYFHDAYKEWTCCNKKSIDFTEFLNYKGCELGKHSNVKPEPIQDNKPSVEETLVENLMNKIEIVNQPKSIETSQMECMKRPDLNTPLTQVQPTIAQSLISAMSNIQISDDNNNNSRDTSIISKDSVCKNSGCGSTYEQYQKTNSDCTHHKGVPVFHEGLKYWSCCTKRTTDFTAFINQIGCSIGEHKWLSDPDETKKITCRYDWHQTGNNIVIAVYAKLYDYKKSFVKVNPIRLIVQLIFPQQDNGEFNIDLELRGIIDVSKTTVNMYGTKVEISLCKAEPGQWLKLDFPKTINDTENSTKKNIKNGSEASTDKNLKDSCSDDEFNLDDIEPMTTGATITDI